MTTFELLICVVLLGLSAFLSSSEIALFSLSRFQLRSLKERFQPTHRKIKRLLSDPAGLLLTILVANEIVNISLSTVITSALSRNWGRIPPVQSFFQLPDWMLQVFAGIALTTPLVLFFGEVTPKVIGVRANQLVAPLNVGPLTWIYTAFKPLRVLHQRLLAILTQSSGSGGETSRPAGDPNEQPLREEEFLSMVEEGHKEGAIQESELELIRNVFELDDRTVCDIATPLQKVYSLPGTTSIRAALIAQKGRRFSRIPVTGGNKKQIVGILYAKDLLLGSGSLKPEDPIADLMRKPFVVPPTMRLNALFRKLKQYQNHMAVVEKAAGEAMAVVTMSDVLDALFEDLLEDETEEAQS